MGYAFTYDDLDRLLGAKYFDITDAGVGTPSQTSTYSTDNKFEEKQTYDVRGNIMSIERNGLNTGTWTNGKQGFTAATYGKIDNLQFNYADGNKLVRVQENSLPDKGFKTVKSPTDYNWQYGYDANGNLRYDFNKNLSYIWYNHLNLPTFIIFTDGRQMTLNYTADGELIQKTTWNPLDNTGYWLQYVNGIEYKNWVLDRIPHPEGSVIRKDDGTYEYEYNLKDHLGSNRVVFRDKDNDRIIDTSDIKQINHTYPFGMDMEGNWNGSFMGTGTQGNAYKYNGKEFNNDFGLGWYHYGARWYAPDAPRWTTVDPLAEKYLAESPYNYVSQNPMNFTDPTGMSKDGVGINNCGDIIYDDNIDDGKLYYFGNNSSTAMVNSTEGSVTIANGKGRWVNPNSNDTKAFFDALLNAEGYTNLNYSVGFKSGNYALAVNPNASLGKRVQALEGTYWTFEFGKPVLELTNDVNNFNIYTLKSRVSHEGLHILQNNDYISGKDMWKSLEDFKFYRETKLEVEAYQKQMNKTNNSWNTLKLKDAEAKRTYDSGSKRTFYSDFMQNVQNKYNDYVKEYNKYIQGKKP